MHSSPIRRRSNAWFRALVRSVLPCLLLMAAATLPVSSASAQMPFAKWPELQKGQAPDTVFQIENIDSINLLNGNLTLRIPLGDSFPVSSSLSYGLTLVYNSNPWESLATNQHECLHQPEVGQPFWIDFYPKTLDQLSNAGPGWMLNLGRFAPPSREYFQLASDIPPYVYVSPDGSHHGLHPELHYDGPTYPDVYHSRDGSFVRMILDADCAPGPGGPCRRLEFSDGSHQEFHAVGADPDDYRPTLIGDAFGNRVTIAYADYSWTLTDDHQRVQRVDFDPLTPARSYSKVQSVTLSAFGGEEAVYDFQYSAPVDVDRHQYLTSTTFDLNCIQFRPIGPDQLLGEAEENVEFLERLVLPDGSYYEMTHAESEGVISGKSGVLEHLRLASGLHYRWQYTWFYGRLAEVQPNPSVPAPFERVAGVGRKQRFILDEAGNEQDFATWEYSPDRALFSGEVDPDIGFPGFTPCFQWTDVSFFDGNLEAQPNLTPIRHSRNYFSTAYAGPPGNWFRSRQSLPFTACPPDGGGVYYTDPTTPYYNDGLFLSQEVLDPANPGGPPIRSVWVEYETDAPFDVDDKDGDRRLTRRRTVFHDDGDRWVESRNEDFDGLGNFRKQVQQSSFEGTEGPKTSLTTFNMRADGGTPSGPQFTPSPTSRWLLGLFDESCVRQGGTLTTCAEAPERSLSDFDPATGFLHATRRLRGNSPSGRDILTLYIDTDDDGQVDSEKIYGGDPASSQESLLPAELGFSPGDAPPDHHIEHTYQHGVLARSVVQENGSPLLTVLDTTIDRNTGLVATSRNPAGLETVLEFDPMRRLTRLEVPGANVTTQLFRYTVPTEANPDLTFPQVSQYCAEGGCRLTPLGLAYEVRDCPPATLDYDSCHGQQIGERRYFYDRQGRLVDERRLIPWTADGADTTKEVLRQNAYDLADRKAWKTEWHATEIGFDVFFTRYLDYDLFDRPHTVERPDGKRTTFVYSGERLTEETLGVWTGSGEDLSTVTTQQDGFGRTIRVTEPAGAGGADSHTTYRYDQGDRLVQVCVADSDANSQNACGGQQRLFTYDGSGLLTAADHPEIDGLVHLTYDARTNMLGKDLAGTAHDLQYVYDAAGRAVEIRDGEGNLFKEFFYSRQNDGPRRIGKLYQARRHNWVPEAAGADTSVDHVVTETFDYSASGNRLASYTVRSDRGASFETRYTYDADGSLASLDYPDCDRAPCSGLDGGPTLEMVNNVGRVVEIPDWLNKVRYRARGTLSRLEHANGVTDEILRNFTLWKPIEKIRVVKPGEVLWDSGSYQYDGAGNVYRIGEGSNQESFTYDLLSRLESSTVRTPFGSATESQTYDAFGNVESINRAGETSVRQLSPSAATNRLPAHLAEYDAGGNVTRWSEDQRDFSYRYAPDNRITSFEGNGQARAFLYTAAGERFAVLDQATGEERYFSRGPNNGLLSRFDRSANDQWERAKDWVRVEGQAVATRAGGVIRHLHHDHLGSTRLITDAAGNVVGDITTFFPFGTYAHDATPGAEELRFTGHERDTVGLATANLDYMHARYYASSIERFLSVDPVLGDVHSPQSWNRYSYAGNNPVAYNDPDGRIAFGVLKQGLKVAIKGGDLAATFAGAVADFNTVRDSNASAGSRVLAAISLASEIASPVSLSDVKAIGAAANITKKLPGQKPSTPDVLKKGRGEPVLVCRGGECKAKNFEEGSGVTAGPDGKLEGISTQSNPNGASVRELSQPFRNNQVGVTTDQAIKDAGGHIDFDGKPWNPNHATVGGLTAEQAEELFTPTIKNPVPKDERGL
ncbi:MAG: RHS repeat-associated core domain-containing protein [Acidobacteriota bacterium]